MDYVIIQQLLWELKPATVFEMGAHEGGSALWMADTLKSYGCNSHVYSVDIDMNIVRALAKESDDITFVHGDLKHVEQVLPAQMLQVCLSCAISNSHQSRTQSLLTSYSACSTKT